MIIEVLKRFGLDEAGTDYELFGGGLINNTWKVTSMQGDFILQQINTDIFPFPGKISDNMFNIKHYLDEHEPDYFFVGPIKTKDAQSVFSTDGYAFRMFPFVQKSITIDRVGNSAQAFQAAKQFGQFTRMLTDFDGSILNIPIQDFHNLNLRTEQYNQALLRADESRLKLASWAIEEISKSAHISDQYDQILANDILGTRIFHHDTKISNILFHADTGDGICVIDLDTVMPGYFISDVGDMMRTYLSPVTEEETNFELINVRKEIFAAIFSGYMGEMGTILSDDEKELFIYAGQFMIFMQSLRFLTDFLNGDTYYGASYPNHNLDRAENQIHLLNKYTACIPEFENIIKQEHLKQIKLRSAS